MKIKQVISAITLFSLVALLSCQDMTKDVVPIIGKVQEPAPLSGARIADIPADRRIWVVYKVMNPCDPTDPTGQQIAFTEVGALTFATQTVPDAEVTPIKGYAIINIRNALYETYLKRPIDRDKSYLVLMRDKKAKRWNVIAELSSEDDVFVYFPYRKNWAFLSCLREDTGSFPIE